MSTLSTAFDVLEITRNNILSTLEPYTIEQLNHIPDGFGNNLIWNFGHVVITQQLLCYGLSNLPMIADNDLVSKYRKGSKPDKANPVTQEEYDLLLDLDKEARRKIQEDYKNGVFTSYKTYTTSYNMTLNNVEEAIEFNNVHEAMHLGTCIALRKFV